MTKWRMASQQGEEERKKRREREREQESKGSRGTGKGGKESVTQVSADGVTILM